MHRTIQIFKIHLYIVFFQNRDEIGFRRSRKLICFEPGKG